MVDPKEPCFQKKLWASKEDVLRTTQVIDTIKLDVWGQSWNAEEEEEEEVSVHGA